MAKEYVECIFRVEKEGLCTDEGLAVFKGTSTGEEIVRCKDCKYFELNHFDCMNGIPLITAHEICMFWGGGCKTRQDGYCFYGRTDD